MAKRILYIATVDWFFISHRLPLAIAAREAGFDVTVAAADTGAAQKIIDAGVSFLPLPFSRSSLNPFVELRSIAAIHRAVRRIRPDVLHTISLKPVLYGGMVGAICRVPKIVSAMTGFGHLFSNEQNQGPMQRAIQGVLRALWRGSGVTIIVQNEDHAEFIEQIGLAERKNIVVIQGAGVDMNRFKPLDKVKSPGTVVLPARMLASKGVLDFAETARRLKTMGFEHRFVLVGPGDDDNPEALSSNELKSLTDSHGVEWWGARTDMETVLAESQLVVLPSKYGEGMPKALIEALACGRPIVTTDIPGCRQLVDNGKNGWLVPPGDIDELTQTIAHALRSPEDLKARGRAGRHFALGKLSVENVTRRTLELYASKGNPNAAGMSRLKDV